MQNKIHVKVLGDLLDKHFKKNIIPFKSIILFLESLKLQKIILLEHSWKIF